MELKKVQRNPEIKRKFCLVNKAGINSNEGVLFLMNSRVKDIFMKDKKSEYFNKIR